MKQNPIIAFLRDRFNLHDDSAHDIEIIGSITKNVEFKGSNLWSLIFAIFIASIGLNVNSTAVIIGAMLVSPLMGPITGIGLGIGINDIELIRKAIKNLLIAVIISVGVSTLYFFITPLHEAQSELLARTTPSIWDVFIAIFGGLAGIVGGTRKEKNNVIPGVAIATALMPPLCTAGFGLATGNLYYFFGAFYLFFINSVFICISSYVVVKYMKLPKKAFEDKGREKRVMRIILALVIVTALPSIYLAYDIVEKSIFENNAARFVKNEFVFKNTHIINKTYKYKRGKMEIELLLLGEDLSPQTIDTLKGRLSKYHISDAKLFITQGLNAKQQVDFSQIKASILEEITSKQEIRQPEYAKADLSVAALPDLSNELRSLYPDMRSYTCTKSVITTIDSGKHDSVILFVGNFAHRLSITDERKLKSWLKSRINADSVVFFAQHTP